MAGATGEQRVLLSTLPADARDKRLALLVVLLSAATFLAALPFAKLQLPQVWAFIPVYESALIVNDLITAVLLFGQFRILGSQALLILASGYLFTAALAAVHLLSFPGAFAPGGLLGAGPQTTAWLYMIWHAGFPLFVLAYIARKGPRFGTTRPVANGRAAIARAAAIVLALVSLGTLLTTEGQNLLPPVMAGSHYTPYLLIVISIVWACSFLALAALWRQKQRTVLDLWLMVVLSAWIFDIGLSVVFNAGRFDLGFYAGRVYGLLSASFVLMVLLTENGTLYARLAIAHAGEQRERKRVQQQSVELAALNQELEAFSYSVAHDLRAPLRSVDGFSQALLEDYADKLDEEGRQHLRYVRESAQQMAMLIDDLLTLSRVTRSELKREEVSLSDTAAAVVTQLRRAAPDRKVDVAIGEGLRSRADPRLLKVALENLLGNAWKFTGKQPAAKIQFGIDASNGELAYFVRDNGAGFDMAYAGKLFGVFQRLHSAAEFDGTGIGLATVQRVIRRHGGKVWAEGEVGRGATFYFTLGAEGDFGGEAQPA